MTILYKLANALATALGNEDRLQEVHGDNCLTMWNPKQEHYPKSYFIDHANYPLKEQGPEETVSVWTWTKDLFVLTVNDDGDLIVAKGNPDPLTLAFLQAIFDRLKALTEAEDDLRTATKRIEEQEAELNRMKSAVATMSAERGVIRDS